MCFNNNCWNQNNCGCSDPFFCPRLQAFVVRGPRGATGPAGPQGPQGIPGSATTTVNNATFSQNASTSVLANGNVPFSTNIALNGNKITHTPGSADITLAAGTYLVTWSASVTTNAEANTVTAGLAVNGAVNMQTTSTVTGTTGNVLGLSGNSVITVPQGVVLNLQNLSASAVPFSNVDLSIINLS